MNQFLNIETDNEYQDLNNRFINRTMIEKIDGVIKETFNDDNSVKYIKGDISSESFSFD